MTPHFRAWIVCLHRWIGYPTGIVLFIIFITGTLATFSLELQDWMQPEIVAHPSPLRPEGLKHAHNLLTEAYKRGEHPFLRLPMARDPVLRLWHYNGHLFLGPALAPATGAIISRRDVVGGSFFVTLHDSLFLPKLWGRGLVGAAGGGMMIALFSGTLLQSRRFFSDLLLLRPRAAFHRFWLDIHLLIGTVALPILTLIGFSGLILQLHSLTQTHSHSMAPSSSLSPPLPSAHLLENLEQQGRHLWGNTSGSFFMIIGDNLALYRPDDAHFCLYRRAITAQHLAPQPSTSCPTLQSILLGIHNMRWAQLPMRWLYCLTGIAGSFVMASGLILFQRREERRFEKIPHPSYFMLHAIRSVNIATLIGLPLAILGLLWSTRLPEWKGTPSFIWETRLFFLIWGSSTLHAIMHPSTARYQIFLLAALGIALLPLDLLTRSWTTERPYLFLSIDGMGFLTGIASLAWHYKGSRG